MTTHQQVFDFIVSRAMSQGVRCTNGKQCAYRGNGDSGSDKRCFAGFLIPDDVYTRSMEGAPISGLIFSEPKLHHLKPVMRFLTLMQQVHDNVEPRHWLSAFYEIGEAFGLDCTQLAQYGIRSEPVIYAGIGRAWNHALTGVRAEMRGEDVPGPVLGLSSYTLDAISPMASEAPPKPSKVDAKSAAMRLMLGDIMKMDTGAGLTVTLATGPGGVKDGKLQPGWLAKELASV